MGPRFRRRRAPMSSVAVSVRRRNDAGHPDPCRSSSGSPSKIPSFYHYQVFEALDRAPLTDGERLTFERLLARDFVDPHGCRKGYVYASKAALAEETGKSERTVQRRLAKLRRLELIRRDPQNPLKIHLRYERLFRFRHRCRSAARGSPPPAVTVKCPGCGEAFQRGRSDQRFCSAACRKRAWKRHQKWVNSNRRPSRHQPSPGIPGSQAGWSDAGGQGETDSGVRDVPPSNKRRCSIRRRLYEYDDQDVPEVDSETVRQLKHPKLRALCRRRGQLNRLFKEFDPDRVLRAILQADLQYGLKDGIRNAYGLIYTMCRDGFDDALLCERERAEERRRRREERAKRLKRLRERGCRRCGFWDVGPTGYCSDCEVGREAR